MLFRHFYFFSLETLFNSARYSKLDMSVFHRPEFLLLLHFSHVYLHSRHRFLTAHWVFKIRFLMAMTGESIRFLEISSIESTNLKIWKFQESRRWDIACCLEKWRRFWIANEFSYQLKLLPMNLANTPEKRTEINDLVECRIKLFNKLAEFEQFNNFINGKSDFTSGQ